MFVDNHMRQWLVDDNINIQNMYSVRIFSKENIKEFELFLNNIENDVSEEHKVIVRDIYH